MENKGQAPEIVAFFLIFDISFRANQTLKKI
jgi:hypothetical protein